jgi:hypothetical protein
MATCDDALYLTLLARVELASMRTAIGEAIAALLLGPQQQKTQGQRRADDLCTTWWGLLASESPKLIGPAISKNVYYVRMHTAAATSSDAVVELC